MWMLHGIVIFSWATDSDVSCSAMLDDWRKHLACTGSKISQRRNQRQRVSVSGQFLPNKNPDANPGELLGQKPCPWPHGCSCTAVRVAISPHDSRYIRADDFERTKLAGSHSELQFWPTVENVKVSTTIKRCHKPLDSCNDKSTLACSSAWALCQHFLKWGMPCWAFRCLPTFQQGRQFITVQNGLAEIRETPKGPRNYKSDSPPDWLDLYLRFT